MWFPSACLGGQILVEVAKHIRYARLGWLPPEAILGMGSGGAGWPPAIPAADPLSPSRGI